MRNLNLSCVWGCLVVLAIGGCSGADDQSPIVTAEVQEELSRAPSDAAQAAERDGRRGRGRGNGHGSAGTGSAGTGTGGTGSGGGSGEGCAGTGTGGVVCALFIEESDGVCSRPPDDPCISQDPDCTSQGRSCEVAGQVFPDGSSVPSGDSCNQCGCNDGEVTCTLALCEEVACLLFVEAPDGVCSRFPLDPCISQDPDCASEADSCRVAGQVFPDGSSVPSGDSCNTCGCDNGSVNCTRIGCEPVFCAAFVEEADGVCSRFPLDPCISQDPDCVPQGQACEAAGQVFPDGSAVPSGDSCNSCGCNDGSVICTLALCEPVACLLFVEQPDGVCSRFPLDPCKSQDPDCAASD